MGKTRIVSATEFKAKCLTLMDEIQQSGMSITVTKRGKPVVEVKPAQKAKWKSTRGMWAGRMKETVDLASLDTSDMWDIVTKGTSYNE